MPVEKSEAVKVRTALSSTVSLLLAPEGASLTGVTTMVAVATAVSFPRPPLVPSPSFSVKVMVRAPPVGLSLFSELRFLNQMFWITCATA
jgi:hypothetical protein